MLKVLVYGGRGWIGSMLVKALREQFPEDVQVIISDTRVGAENAEVLKKEIAEVDRVVCTVGRTGGVTEDGVVINTIDYLEGRLKENVRDNLYAPVVLMMLCMQLGKHLSYLGTGCIFSWDTNADTERRVHEEDFPDFFGSSYSVVKGFTDSLTRLCPNVLNWRIRMPITADDHPKSFITKIKGYSKVNSNNNSMTYLPEIIDVMAGMVVKATVGTYNMTNPGFMNHREILEEYKKQVDPDHACEYVEGESNLSLKSKRSSNIMSTEKLEGWANENNTAISDINTDVSASLHHQSLQRTRRQQRAERKYMREHSPDHPMYAT